MEVGEMQGLREKVRKRLAVHCQDPLVEALVYYINEDDLIAACTKIGMLKEGKGCLISPKSVVNEMTKELKPKCQLK
jgi:hypothetical protein